MIVVTVASGGLPVVDVTVSTPTLGHPVYESTAGGVAVTKVSTRGAMAVTYTGGTVVAGAPVLTKAQVTSTSPSPTQVTLTYSAALDATSVPAASAFLVIRNFISKVPQTVSVSGSTCVVTLDADYGDPNGGTISYTPPGTNMLRGSGGGTVCAAFSNVAIDPSVPVVVTYTTWNPSDKTASMGLSLGNLK